MSGGLVQPSALPTALAALHKAEVPLLVCANRGRVPNTLGSAATTNNVCAESRRSLNIGGAAQGELRAVYAGYYVDSTGGGTNGQEVATGNDVTIEAAIEITGAPNPVVRFTFSAANTGTIVNGVAEYVSDAIYPWQFGLTSFAANTQFWYRERRTISVGQKFARYGSLQSLTGESTRLSDGGGASQVLTTGVMTTPTNGSNISLCFAAMTIIGRAIGTPDIAILAFGDSIMNGSNDPYFGGNSDGSDAHGGWFTVGLYSVGGRAVPHTLGAANGTKALETMEQPSMATAFAKRRVLGKYHTHMMENFGTNDDGSAGTGHAAIYLARRKLWGAMRGGDSMIRHITAVPIINRTGSANGWKDTNGQTANTGYTAGATQDLLNADLATSLASGEINAIFDLQTPLGANNLWKIAASGSRSVADGAITSGTRTLTSATANFVSGAGGDAGKSVTITGAGAAGALLCGSIVSVTNATTVICNFITTSTNASTTVTNATVDIGYALTDDGTHPNEAGEAIAATAFAAFVGALGTGLI